jgi:hypothetical protein
MKVTHPDFAAEFDAYFDEYGNPRDDLPLDTESAEPSQTEETFNAELLWLA